MNGECKMTLEKHKEKHKRLHSELDELIADYLLHTDMGILNSSIMDLIRWSFGQTKDPTEKE